MTALYETPHPFDLESWKQHLDWLRSEPGVNPTENDIWFAELNIAYLEEANAQQAVSQGK